MVALVCKSIANPLSIIIMIIIYVSCSSIVKAQAQDVNISEFRCSSAVKVTDTKRELMESAIILSEAEASLTEEEKRARVREVEARLSEEKRARVTAADARLTDEEKRVRVTEAEARLTDEEKQARVREVEARVSKSVAQARYSQLATLAAGSPGGPGYSVFFDVDSFSLSRDAEFTINVAVSRYNNDNDLQKTAVVIIGYADDTGTSGHNFTLSYMRANAVAKSMIRSGLDRSKLCTLGVGEIKENVSQTLKRKVVINFW